MSEPQTEQCLKCGMYSQVGKHECWMDLLEKVIPSQEEPKQTPNFYVEQERKDILDALTDIQMDVAFIERKIQRLTRHINTLILIN